MLNFRAKLRPIRFSLNKSIHIILFLFAFTQAISGVAQDSLARKPSIIGYPIGFYSPETGFGAGLAMAYSFYTDRTDTIAPASQIQLGLGFTQKNQTIFSLPFDFYFKERKHQISGEFSYTDFSYDFYGVGDMDNVDEKFEVEFPRFRINYLKKIRPFVFVGARWWFEKYDLIKTQSGGILESGIIEGSSGNVTSGPGVILLFDSRDNVYASAKGHYLELVFHNQDKLWGSDYAYNRYRFDYRFFHSISKRQTFGFNFFGDFVGGRVPFNQLPLIGGAKRMRGFYEGRFRDMNLILAQFEYRKQIFNRWGINLFMNNAWLAGEPDEFNRSDSHFAAGAGLRYFFDKEKKVHIRLDAAFSKHKPAFYFTIGEAF